MNFFSGLSKDSLYLSSLGFDNGCNSVFDSGALVLKYSGTNGLYEEFGLEKCISTMNYELFVCMYTF